MRAEPFVVRAATGHPTPRSRRVRPTRLASRLGMAVLAVALAAQGARADMSLGRNSAAADGYGSIDTGVIKELASVTISSVRRHTIILVDATVSGIDPLPDVEVYLEFNGVLSGPVTHCPATAQDCTLNFHRPIDADGPLVTIGQPITFKLMAYAPNGAAPSVQYGFTAHAVKK